MLERIKKIRKMENKRNEDLIFIMGMFLIFIFLFLILIGGRVPTDQQDVVIRECQINLCKERNLTSYLEPREEGMYASHIINYHYIECYSENGLLHEFKIKEGIWERCGIEPDCIAHRRFKIRCLN